MQLFDALAEFAITPDADFNSIATKVPTAHEALAKNQGRFRHPA